MFFNHTSIIEIISTCYFKSKFVLNIKKAALFFSVFFSFGIFAANYYIATTGSDAANGTAVGTPKLTLANVFSTYNLGSGDIINVAAGTYTEKGIVIGSDDEGFTIQGAALAAGVPTTIFDSDQTDGWLYFGDANNDNITISKIHIKDYKETPTGGSGLRIIDGCTGLSISNGEFYNLTL